MYTEAARAKINLNLHVGRRVLDRSDPYFGYHPLSSLVAFADQGDRLSCEQAKETTITITGPFAGDLPADETNLVLKAYAATAKHGSVPKLRFHLDKNLPVASGIGGGSADAAAALRLLKNYVALPEETWLEIALSLGADVPVCYYSRTCIMTGIGEDIRILDNLKPVNAVLANPGAKVSTADVFRIFDETNAGKRIKEQSGGDLVKRFLAGRNDLQDAAIKVSTDIRTCLKSIGASARMSGSGATCFGLLPDQGSAHILAKTLKKNHPDWWVQPAILGDQS